MLPPPAVLAAALVVANAAPLAAETQRSAGPEKIEIRAIPIDSFDARAPERRQFGALEFRGGLELSSSHRQFGGLSALKVAPDGSFLALSDKAHWLRGRIVYRGGKPSGIVNAEIAPMLGTDGRTITARGWYDSEALADDGSGIVYVSFERVHRIVRFDMSREGLSARGQPISVPPELAKLPSNGGIECLIVPPKTSPLAGALIGISERGYEADGSIRGFIIGGQKPGVFSVKRSDEFDIVDCALTPNADVLILERRFSWRRGVAMRIRRVPLSSVAAGAVLDGPILIDADMGYQIDNMEGLSVHRGANGETVLTLVSDDNFSMIQRTLLLQFTLPDR
jgi:hypothetical protein